MNLFKKIFGIADPPTTFESTDQMMNEETFWKIIQISHDNSDGDFEQQQDELEKELEKLSPADIILFDNRFRYFKLQAYTWELWGAIYIAHGGCGDDAFNDFREWVIGQGKDFYFKTIEDPEHIMHVQEEILENGEWEGLGYVASTVFENRTKQELPELHDKLVEPTTPSGKEWSEDSDDLKNMFPKLAARFSHNLPG